MKKRETGEYTGPHETVQGGGGSITGAKYPAFLIRNL